jgi:hypothetical protein
MRRRSVHRNVEPSVASHFPSLSKGPDIDANVRMFTEDIHLAIMPIGGRTERQENFTVELQGEEPDCEKAKAIIGELGEFDRYDNAAMACDAVDNIAKRLAWEGQAVYEIIKDNEQIYLHGFTSKNLIQIILWYLQIIPPGDWDLWKRKYNLINNKKIWKVKIPYELGGISGYKRILKRLKKYDYLGPKFYRKDLERGETPKNYDFLKYVRNSKIYFNRVTHKWGWNRRDWSQERCTEFYTFYKMLSFRYAQAILREHIIKEINQLLERLSVKCKLFVGGLPTAKEILQIRNDMQKGLVSFTEVSAKV